MKPANAKYGYSAAMGPQLRALVEQHLTSDVRYYGLSSPGLRFDWSNSCIESHDAQFLDGWVENYSGIAIYDADDRLIAEGWMDFVLAEPFFLAYWDALDVWENGRLRGAKTAFGMPDHIWQQLPAHLQERYRVERLPQPPFHQPN